MSMQRAAMSSKEQLSVSSVSSVIFVGSVGFVGSVSSVGSAAKSNNEHVTSAAKSSFLLVL